MKIIDWLHGLFRPPEAGIYNIDSYRIQAEKHAALDAFALFTAVHLISSLLSACEFRTFRRGTELHGEEWYSLNVRPNKNQKMKNLCEIIEGLSGIKLSVGTVSNMLHSAAEMAKPIVDDFPQKLLQKPVVHCDETGLRVNGALVRLVEKLAEKIPDLLLKITGYLPRIVQGVMDFITDFVKNNAPLVLKTAIAIAQAFVKAAPEIAKAIYPMIPQIMDMLKLTIPMAFADSLPVYTVPQLRHGRSTRTPAKTLAVVMHGSQLTFSGEGYPQQCLCGCVGGLSPCLLLCQRSGGCAGARAGGDRRQGHEHDRSAQHHEAQRQWRNGLLRRSARCDVGRGSWNPVGAQLPHEPSRD